MLVLSDETDSSSIRRIHRSLQLLERTIKNPRLGSAVHVRVDPVPVAEALGQPRHFQPCSVTYKIALSTYS